MRITIDTAVLKKYNLSLEQYLILLSSYYNLDYDNIQKELEARELTNKNLFSNFPPVISDNTKNMVARIIVESDEKINHCGIEDFEALAIKCQQLFPDGIKAGKSYPWRGKTEEIAQKLRTLVVKYNFTFTEEEAINAVQEYVSSFQSPYTYMHTLRNFILYTKREGNEFTMESIFMSIIENNREQTKTE